MALSHKRRRALLEKIVERDGLGCWYCGRTLLDPRTEAGKYPLGKLPDNYPTIDHVIPRVLGGTNSVSNLKASCPQCNNQKASKFKPSIVPSTLDQAKAIVCELSGKVVATETENRALRREREALLDELRKLRQDGVTLKPEEMKRAEQALNEVRREVKKLSRERAKLAMKIENGKGTK